MTGNCTSSRVIAQAKRRYTIDILLRMMSRCVTVYSGCENTYGESVKYLR